ncbi:MAG: hypothetical protein L3J98_00665 [Gammaproteobacteria bacterium]|nr:hypothetical protein [Gammaproteobacteria bacterium]MCF6258666.1 hypothetical protein [Gammaproteobacteria bacterium]
MLTDDINRAFGFDDNYLPPMTLRSGCEADNYNDILPFDTCWMHQQMNIWKVIMMA